MLDPTCWAAEQRPRKQTNQKSKAGFAGKDTYEDEKLEEAHENAGGIEGSEEASSAADLGEPLWEFPGIDGNWTEFKDGVNDNTIFESRYHQYLGDSTKGM